MGCGDGAGVGGDTGGVVLAVNVEGVVVVEMVAVNVSVVSVAPADHSHETSRCHKRQHANSRFSAKTQPTSIPPHPSPRCLPFNLPHIRRPSFRSPSKNHEPIPGDIDMTQLN